MTPIEPSSIESARYNFEHVYENLLADTRQRVLWEIPSYCDLSLKDLFIYK